MDPFEFLRDAVDLRYQVVLGSVMDVLSHEKLDWWYMLDLRSASYVFFVRDDLRQRPFLPLSKLCVTEFDRIDGGCVMQSSWAQKL